ncbi:hypothetical protein PPUJ20066_38340 [Pseudomonas putida]|nr:hypothetical protein CR512_12005 [Pseudomonas putida]GLO57798.1 hypothetical protein PPUJ20066_38340 [Pseudomonas putida]
MIKLEPIKAWGTQPGTDKPLELDEISILASPAMIRALGVFLINAAYEMDTNEAEHIHLQDLASNFSYDHHVDIVLNNKLKVNPDPK